MTFTFFTEPLSAPHQGHVAHFLVISVILRRSRVRSSASVAGARMRLSSRRRSSGFSSTREHVLQMFCSTLMVALRKPMWNTGSSSVITPQWPGHCSGSRSHVPHFANLPPLPFDTPSRGSCTPNATASRWGGIV